LKSNCKRIILECYTSFSVQGVNLREEVEKFVREPREGKVLEIKGRVRNLKDGKVEIIYKGNDIAFLYNQISEWKKDQKFGIKDIKRNDHFDPDAEGFNDFTIERLDDLSEMVLALRGAGYRFIESTKTLERINQVIRVW
jgi:acylphosphatase